MTSTLLSLRVPVADLRKKPIVAGRGAHDDLQESQLLANELFRPLRDEDSWYYGEAIEQPHYAEGCWRGYPGWVKKNELVSVEMAEKHNAVVIWREADLFSDPICSGQSLVNLPLGSRIRLDPELDTNPGFSRVFLRSGQAGWVRKDALRMFDGFPTGLLHDDLSREVINNAFLFLDVPYLWGGMNASRYGISSGTDWGVDCSALVCLSYRLSGIDIPRNAHDQWFFAEPVEGNDVRIGDLVFLSKEDAPKAIRHVMICTGPESIIEASETGRTVSETSFTEKFGLCYGELRQAGFAVGGKRFYFGRITKGLDLEALYKV